MKRKSLGRLAAAPERRLLSGEEVGSVGDQARGAHQVFRRQEHELLGRRRLDLSGGQPQRMGVESLLEDRPREARVAEALAAALFVVDGKLARDREQLVGRVVREDDLPREAGP